MPCTRVRRALLGALAPVLLVPLVACAADDPAGSPGSSSSSTAPSEPSAGSSALPYARDLSELERKFDAHLGVYAVDTGSGEEVAYHDGERFAYNSTFKALAAAVVLQKFSLAGLDRVIEYSEEDLLDNSPVTEKHVTEGELTLGELCDAAVRYSDNAAANLILDALGGPKALDAALEKVGDDVTRMDRFEPELNRWTPGENRDTTTPRAFADDLRTFVLGETLDRPERDQLTTWLRNNTTGDELIRAGVPDTWVVGDKTGAGSYHGTRNDIAVLWPSNADPIVVAIMSYRSAKDADYDNRLIAEAASVVADSLS